MGVANPMSRTRQMKDKIYLLSMALSFPQNAPSLFLYWQILHLKEKQKFSSQSSDF
jgi:hypothetical protein